MQDIQADGLGRDWPQRQAVRTTLRTTLFAVVAAVSMRRGMICFHARPKSFTAAAFQDFLQDLRDELPSGRVSVLLDNCSIHKARVTLAKAAELQMDMHFNVPYAPQFNGIECVWNIAK